VNPSFISLIIFSLAVIAFKATGIPKLIDSETLARIVVLLGILPAVTITYLQAKKFTNPRKRTPSIIIKLKSVVIWTYLGAILAFSTGMSLVFPSWPGSHFLYDYIFILPVLFIATPLYVKWAEPKLKSSRDSYFSFAKALIGRRNWKWSEQRQLLLSTLVKIFFIPIMYSALITSVELLLNLELHSNPTIAVAALFLFGLSSDLLLATGGYIFSSRILNNEVLSTDESLAGWFFCIICYPPFLFILNTLSKQADTITWEQWLLPNQPLYWLWALTLTTTWVIYWISTACFGLRFSNLSWRGIVSSGPYKYTKHPAYISKNIYWWMHTVPFIGITNLIEFSHNIFGLIIISLTYFLRAKTEELHLLKFPDYCNYASQIKNHGIAARSFLMLRKALHL